MYLIAGEIYSSLDTEELQSHLTDCDIRSILRDSAHFNNHTYIRIEEGISEFIIETWDELLSYDVTGWSLSLEQMDRAAEKVSFALTYLDIPHAFEIYIDSDNSKTAELIYCLEYSCSP